MATLSSAPKEILIVGAGVFGLSTALAFLDRPQYSNSTITIIDSSPTLPNPDGSSVDASRIIRPDYANVSYAKLACLAQEHWRDQTPSGWGGESRYAETGFVLTADKGQDAYVQAALHNVQDLAKAGLPVALDKIEVLPNRDSVKRATGLPGSSGSIGYANWNSGWADAEACVAHALHRINIHPNGRNRITIRKNCKVSRLLFSDTTGQCAGVVCTNDSTIHADLTVLAAGAWTSSLFDLSNRALATGQAVAFLKLTQEEQDYLGPGPVMMNFAKGTFIIPPQKRELKIARHGFGYRNLVTVSHATAAHESPSFLEAEVSVPRTDHQMPIEAEHALREALAELFPPSPDPASIPPGYPESLRDASTRPFSSTRLCWYTDTPTADFIIDYPPLCKASTSSPQHNTNTSLLIATGGSGHGFKFFPILGTYIVDAIERKLAPEYKEMWAWPTDQALKKERRTEPGHEGRADTTVNAFLECEDGSRGGPHGMILEEELTKGVVAVAGADLNAKL